MNWSHSKPRLPEVELLWMGHGVRPQTASGSTCVFGGGGAAQGEGGQVVAKRGEVDAGLDQPLHGGLGDLFFVSTVFKSMFMQRKGFHHQYIE